MVFFQVAILGVFGSSEGCSVLGCFLLSLDFSEVFFVSLQSPLLSHLWSMVFPPRSMVFFN